LKSPVELPKKPCPWPQGLGDKALLGDVLAILATLESDLRNFDRSLELFGSALAIKRELGQSHDALVMAQFIACDLRSMGRLEEAHRRMYQQLPEMLRLAEQGELTYVAEDYAAVLAELGQHEPAALLLGCADAWRERHGTPRGFSQVSVPRCTWSRSTPSPALVLTCGDGDLLRSLRAGVA
jgi:hypothetical protein